MDGPGICVYAESLVCPDRAWQSYVSLVGQEWHDRRERANGFQQGFCTALVLLYTIISSKTLRHSTADSQQTYLVVLRLFLHVQRERAGVRPPGQRTHVRPALPLRRVELALRVPHVEQPVLHACLEGEEVEVEQRAVRVGRGVEAVQQAGELERRADAATPLQVSAK